VTSVQKGYKNKKSISKFRKNGKSIARSTTVFSVLEPYQNLIQTGLCGVKNKIPSGGGRFSRWGSQVHVKKTWTTFFIKRFTLTMDAILIVLLKLI